LYSATRSANTASGATGEDRVTDPLVAGVGSGFRDPEQRRQTSPEGRSGRAAEEGAAQVVHPGVGVLPGDEVAAVVVGVYVVEPIGVRAAMSGMEREYIRDRALQGHEPARKRGKTSGGDGVTDYDMQCMALHLRDQEMSLRDIAKRLVITTGAKGASIPR